MSQCPLGEGFAHRHPCFFVSSREACVCKTERESERFCRISHLHWQLMTSKLSEGASVGRMRLELEPHLLTLCSSQPLNEHLLMTAGPQAVDGVHRCNNQLKKISQVQSIGAVDRESHQQDTGSGSSEQEKGSSDRGIRQLEVS